MDKQQMLAHLDQRQEELVNLSDSIWDYAETAFEEHRSVALLTAYLKEKEFSVEEGIGKVPTAFCASWGESGPVVGILAEYDALAGLSQKAHSAQKEAETSGANGHGCGHNLFAGGSVGAAVAVKEYLQQNGLPGVVKLFGCPGEEGGSGKAFMAREGVFDGVDFALAWHPMGVNAIFDTCMLANYQVLYKFRGTASHAAAAPHLGRSALDAVELMNVGVNFLREHVVQEARMHYAITNAGGFSPNVVQPTADVLYLLRAPTTPQVEEIYQRVNKIAEGAAMMTETEVEIEFIKACSNLVPNKTLSKVLYDNFLEQPMPTYTEEELAFAAEIAATAPGAGKGLASEIPLPAADLRRYGKLLEGKPLCDLVLPFYENGPDVQMAGSTDVGDVSWNVPTAQIVTACYAMGTPGHSWQLVSQGRTSIGHKGMLLAAKVMAGATVDLLADPETVQRAKQELLDRLDGEHYHCAIPPQVKPRAISQL